MISEFFLEKKTFSRFGLKRVGTSGHVLVVVFSSPKEQAHTPARTRRLLSHSRHVGVESSGFFWEQLLQFFGQSKHSYPFKYVFSGHFTMQSVLYTTLDDSQVQIPFFMKKFVLQVSHPVGVEVQVIQGASQLAQVFPIKTLVLAVSSHRQEESGWRMASP